MTGVADDVDRIMAVMGSAFDPQYGEAWTRRQVVDAFFLGHCHYILADCDGKSPKIDTKPEEIAGFALTRSGLDEEELLLFAVVPQLRGRGIGDQLLTRFASDAQKRGAQRLLLEMRRGNPAESLYLRHGFTPVGLRKNYYRTSSGGQIDAITFVRELIECQ